MKNLLIFLNPSHEFDDEGKRLVKIQIDNSLDLGWKREDILLVTNFPYEFNGVKALEVPDNIYCDYWKQMSKINAILYLFYLGLINDTFWFHDMEAFQVQPLDFTLTKDLALTDYGYMKKWQTGILFFNQNSRDTIQLIHDRAYELQTDEERALDDLTKDNKLKDKLEILNITHNFPGSIHALRHFEEVYNKAEKPIKVVHFHPDRFKGKFFRVMMGLNPLGVKIMTDRLINLFKKYDATGTRSH